MPISAAYQREVSAKLYVHVEGEEPFEATDADLLNFGYVKIDLDQEKLEEEPRIKAVPEATKSEFDAKPFIEAGLRFGGRAAKAAKIAKDVTVTVVRDKVNEANKTNEANKK